MSNDQEYFARRAQQHRDSAARSDDSIAQRVHREMAERYDARCDQVAAIPPQPAD